MPEPLTKEIVLANEIRNTYHFMKSRKAIINMGKVEKTLEILVSVIEIAPKMIKQKSEEVPELIAT